jgi:hypothetical protein
LRENANNLQKVSFPTYEPGEVTFSVIAGDFGIHCPNWLVGSTDVDAALEEGAIPDRDALCRHSPG